MRDLRPAMHAPDESPRALRPALPARRAVPKLARPGTRRLPGGNPRDRAPAVPNTWRHPAKTHAPGAHRCAAINLSPPPGMGETSSAGGSGSTHPGLLGKWRIVGCLGTKLVPARVPYGLAWPRQLERWRPASKPGRSLHSSSWSALTSSEVTRRMHRNVGNTSSSVESGE